MFRISISLVVITSFLLSCSTETKDPEDNRPNFLLIIADDLGYTDLGCFGGEITTPNIDSFSESGIRFSNFHTAPTCAPTRAMLYSGNDNHIAGMGSQFRKTGEWGYEGYLTHRIIPFPQLLNDAGYHTYMTGKWHLGIEKEQNPHSKGIENSFVCLFGAANHYDNQGLFRSNPISLYTENGTPAEWPKDAYSTELYTDKLIEFIGSNRKDKKPFLAIAAYTSPHWPLQVDEEFWRKYEGNYSEGYEKLRFKRFESMKNIGIIPENSGMPEIHPKVQPWESLTEEQRMREERKMELYAGMVDNLDFHVGRLVNHLKEIGEYDNTVIVFMSDNGAASRDFFSMPNHHEFLKDFFSNEYENMGDRDSYVSYGPPWAEAGTAGFRYFKDYTTEGGIRTPMIITGPGIEPQGGFSKEFTSLLDIAPTFLEMAGVTYPESYNNNVVFALRGESMVEFLKGDAEAVHDKDYVYTMEQSGNAVVIKDGWKLMSIYSSDTAEFKLFNAEFEMAEQSDLSGQYPNKKNELMAHWLKYREEMKVIPVTSITDTD